MQDAQERPSHGLNTGNVAVTDVTGIGISLASTSHGSDKYQNDFSEYQTHPTHLCDFTITSTSFGRQRKSEGGDKEVQQICASTVNEHPLQYLYIQEFNH